MKFQNPSSKLQRSTNFQALNQSRSRRAWSLVLGISLVLGSWSLVRSLPAQPVPIDFSTAGYAANEKPIPLAPVRVIVTARSGDSTARIQAALDHVSSLTPDADGLRGAVLLLKGRHEILGGLLITHSGVVLRGQGVNNTTLVAAGLDRRTLIRVVGSPATTTGPRITISESVPVGATNLQVTDATYIRPLSPIRLIRPSTTNWIAQLRAREFGGGIGGGWKPGSRDITWDRIVTAVSGNTLTLDAPITTAIESGAFISPISPIGRISEVGIENLTLESTFDPANLKDENHFWCAITMENTADAWVRQVTFKHFAGSAVALYETTQRITVQDCVSLAPISEVGGYRRHTFFTMGQQTLFLRCYSEQGRHDFSVGHCAAGPNAFVQCEAREALADSGPIESWASGVLYDNVNIDGNALTLGYRPGNNAGIGWAAANSVLWNCSASVIRCWNPPGATNWSFGSWASFEGDGVWRSSNDFMKPDSLFAAQLDARLGTNSGGASVPASRRLQLMPRPREESSNPPLDKAQELAAASHQPAPQLRDYILNASQREPIPSEPGDAKRVEALSLTPGFSRVSDRVKDGPTVSAVSHAPEAVETATDPRTANTGLKPGANEIGRNQRDSDQSSNRKSEIVNLKLVLTNGWLTIDGKLAIGSTANVTWWRGSIRPNEAKEFGLGVTRFVPGRIGAGFTDDLTEVADKLIANGDVALDHNYGLWYDRRRDDHERIRRINGDALPPFYEQPFARSGQGAAWEGLSKYDLTKFNPWYWSRLREFADIADERGLVLFHQNYFQHNILEAGAHWADSPWRSANNINNTGFPEPPPYAGDKRIFQAELFYDVTHPVRRKLHEGYIRQCLDNFANNANVIQFTSAEFTGPLPFMQFWLDTIAAREKLAIGNRQSAIHPLVALSATKDVQDAILADKKRSVVVDVIDFRYWWRTDKGEFAPPGGKNLSPRQFERMWKGGRPNEGNLASMAAEYRALHPHKAVICDFDAAGWAWVCAGGSMPRLPRTTDAKLLAAIPQMRHWQSNVEKKTYALGKPGKYYLAYGGGELDLSRETGSYRMNTVNQHTGEVTAGEMIQSGGKTKLPDDVVVWLTKE